MVVTFVVICVPRVVVMVVAICVPRVVVLARSAFGWLDLYMQVVNVYLGNSVCKLFFLKFPEISDGI